MNLTSQGSLWANIADWQRAQSPARVDDESEVVIRRILNCPILANRSQVKVVRARGVKAALAAGGTKEKDEEEERETARHWKEGKRGQKKNNNQKIIIINNQREKKKKSIQ
jgi:hypothetical protein